MAKCDANYSQLTPLSTFHRAATLFPSQPAYVSNHITRTWSEMHKRVSKFAAALHANGVRKGDVVSFMAANSAPMFEAHFAVPGLGSVLHSINTRLDSSTIAFQLNHANPKVVVIDSEFNDIMREAVAIASKDTEFKAPLFINIHEDDNIMMHTDTRISTVEYEEFISAGSDTFELLPCEDEWDAISLNYTSGTTGNPKGVVCTHRGAYLNSLSNVAEWNMQRFSKLLMIVPMFHCNGWNFTWTMANLAGCAFFMRHVQAEGIFDLISKHNIQYMCGAPITMTTMLSYPQRQKFTHEVKMLTGGAPPPPSLLKRFTDETGVTIRTSYGLTESYGPATFHYPDPEWDALNWSAEELLGKVTQQAQTAIEERVCVMNPDTMQPVPADSTTLGEVMIKGNIMMKGYFKNPAATHEAFKNGWFHTGDLAVSHGKGRFEIKDRSKDIIISGGENISSIQVETVIITHPSIMEVAVVAMPDEKWGEVPCAFVTLDPLARKVTEAELIAWARGKMAHFMAPKRFVFSELPKTATGKVQKNLLRKML
eukprot:CAMPEP_0170360172 /NCGR_PEP_ID=MMETSP0117_2-20130122/3141_1 /TAXON_ID=400756 /ORGANISM="Durinskia baltica, Strain CSIRO CS-38" /LENGTH=538 /DNA_ID=CAMNT_0010614473 /DNA_START=117 /DNA_END=1733 /DNA_ORIENTATION=+